MRVAAPILWPILCRDFLPPPASRLLESAQMADTLDAELLKLAAKCHQIASDPNILESTRDDARALHGDHMKLVANPPVSAKGRRELEARMKSLKKRMEEFLR